MAYPDYPFPSQPPSYIRHPDVLAYLQDYAKQFNLLPYIKFGASVESLSRQECQGKSCWTLTYSDLNSHQTTTTTFDAVIVCTGFVS